MKSVLLALVLSFVSLEAQAISRYNPTTMSCAEVKGTVRSEGAVILRWQSPRGMPLYNRYVAHDGYCSTSEEAERAFVPSADRQSCAVFECKQRTFDDDDFFFLRRRHH